MLLAAGRGERMRPLTDSCPKPLLCVGGKPLIVWHIERLAAAGLRELVINHAHLGAQLVAALGDGERFGVKIAWSSEPEGALETAGGIAQALPLLGNDPFLVINGDIFCDWDVARAPVIATQMSNDLAYLVLVPNPIQHPAGDFALQAQRVDETGTEMLTFAGVGIYHPALFSSIARGSIAKLAPLLRTAMRDKRVSGECHGGFWEDVGTPERLLKLNAELGEKLDC
jgi:N-acetyl-alpha-D-muramate 1-phosphate uridylyltransferase